MNSTFTKSKVRLTPNNNPSGNRFTATNFSTINFIIAKQPAFLDPRTLRLNGTFSLLNAAGDEPVNDYQTAGSATNGATLNNRIGVQSCINEVTVQTLNGRNLENLRNYNQYLSAAKPLMNNTFDYDNGLGLQDSLLCNKSITNARVANVQTEFSIPIEVGMLGDKPLNISEKGFHGLQLNILLAQNAQALQGFYVYSEDNGTKVRIVQPAAQQGFSYNLENVSLTFDLIRPSQEIFNTLPSSGIISFNSISSLTSTLLSSDQTINLRLGVKNCLSVTHSMLPSNQVNNGLVDSFRLAEPELNSQADGSLVNVAKINQVQYLRSGQLFPYNFVLDSETQGAENNPQAQIEEPALNSITLYENRHQMMNPNTQLGLNTSSQFGGDAGTIPLNYPQAADPSSLFLLGVPMDSQRQGVDFRQNDYSVRIQSALNDTNANTVYTFCRARNIAAFSPTGIEVTE